MSFSNNNSQAFPEVAGKNALLTANQLLIPKALVSYREVEATIPNSHAKSKLSSFCAKMRLPPPQIHFSVLDEIWCGTACYMGFGISIRKRNKQEIETIIAQSIWIRLSQVVQAWERLIEDEASDHGFLRDFPQSETSDAADEPPWLSSFLGALTQSTWQRDLTTEGIEPNPGPPTKKIGRGKSNQKRKKMPRKQATSKKKSVARAHANPKKQELRKTLLMPSLKAMTANAIVVEHPTAFGSAVQDTHLEDMVAAFVNVAYWQAPPNPREMNGSGGSFGDLCPMWVKAYLMQYVLTHLRRVGSLTSLTGADVYGTFPDFGDDNPVPVGLVNYLEYFMPYSSGSGSLEVRMQHLFAVPDDYFTALSNAFISPTSSKVAYAFEFYQTPCLVPTTTTAPYREWAYSFANNVVGTPRSIFNVGNTTREAVMTYLNGVFHCVPSKLTRHKAPDASTYAIGHRSIPSGTYFMGPSDHFSTMVAEITIIPVSSQIAQPAIVKRSGGFASEVTSWTTDFGYNGVRNYALCSLDFKKHGLMAALGASKYSGLETFVPTLARWSTSAASMLLFETATRLGLTSTQISALSIVFWSKVMFAARHGLSFTKSEYLVHDSFGLTPLPAPLATYVDGLGPVVVAGRVQYLCVQQFIPATVVSGAGNWLSRMIFGTPTPTNTDTSSFWNGNVGYASGNTIGNLQFVIANFPPASWNVLAGIVVVPVEMATNIQDVYAQIPAFNNFVPTMPSPLGSRDQMAIVDTNIDGGSGYGQSFAGHTININQLVNNVYSIIAGSASDAVRAASMSYRLVNPAWDVRRLTCFNVVGLGVAHITNDLAAWLTSGTGYTYIVQRTAEAQPKTKSMGETVAGFTVPSDQVSANTTRIVRETVNDFASTIANRIQDVSRASPHDVAKTSMQHHAKYNFSEFLPGLIKRAGSVLKGNAVKLSEKQVEKDLAYYVANPEEAIQLGKKVAHMLF